MGVEPDDEAAICERLFRGLVFFLGREVPREQLLFVIRAFGGTAGWDGEGSPVQENDEGITHQVGVFTACAHLCNRLCCSMVCSTALCLYTG